MRTLIEVETEAHHIEGIVAALKTFLIHIGYAPRCVADIGYADSEKQQSLPEQLDFFPESR